MPEIVPLTVLVAGIAMAMYVGHNQETCDEPFVLWLVITICWVLIVTRIRHLTNEGGLILLFCFGGIIGFPLGLVSSVMRREQESQSADTTKQAV